MALVCANSAAAYSTFKTVYGFCSKYDHHCVDGANPKSQLLIDQLGNLYSGPIAGGKYGYGDVLRVSPPKWNWKVLHSFCDPDPPNCPHGDKGQGSSALIMDTSGNFYGLSAGDDPYHSFEYGILFELSNSTGKWVLSVKHKFCRSGLPFCQDGAFPLTDGLVYAGQGTGAPWDGVSPLYGVTLEGGTKGGGIVFQMVPGHSGWKETAIHNFEDSAYPNGLVADAVGHLYGSAQQYGKYNFGFLYKLVQNGDGTWTQTDLHNFCKLCARTPVGRLFLDKSHDLFGTTLQGGSTPYCTGQQYGCGTAFELTQDGQYKEIYDFCSLPSCMDGFVAYGLTMDAAGNLLGTAQLGGVAAYCPDEDGCGTVFELTQNAGVWSGATLYSFCNQAECTDGVGLLSPLTLDSAGNIFGTTDDYGPHGEGTIFEILH
jgi:hypothetical protein